MWHQSWLNRILVPTSAPCHNIPPVLPLCIGGDTLLKVWLIFLKDQTIWNLVTSESWLEIAVGWPWLPQHLIRLVWHFILLPILKIFYRTFYCDICNDMTIITCDILYLLIQLNVSVGVGMEIEVINGWRTLQASTNFHRVNLFLF